MHCNYCGRQINSDDVIREQRLGVDTDTIEGTLVEVERFVTSAKCDSCGTQTNYELDYRDKIHDLEVSYDDERKSSA